MRDQMSGRRSRVRPIRSSRVTRPVALTSRRTGLVVAPILILVWALTVIRPVSHNAQLFGLLSILFGASVYQMVARRRQPFPVPSAGFGALLFVGAGACLYGALRHNPGASFLVLPYVFGPLLYFLIAQTITWRHIEMAVRALPWITIVLSVGIILTALGERGSHVPVLSTVFGYFDFGSVVIARGGYVEVRFYGLSSLLALVPMMGTMLHGRKELGLTKANRYVAYAAYALGLLATFLTGRRMLQILVIAGPAISYFAVRYGVGASRKRAKIGRNIFRYALGLVGALMVAGAFGLRVSTLVRLLSFNGGKSDDISIRVNQTKALLGHWARQPFFGAGAGAVLDDFVRDPIRPWNFEAQYPLLLFQGGLFGAWLWISGMRAIFRASKQALAKREKRMRHIFAMSVTGSVAMIVANGTNPYLQAVGHHWALFAPALVAGAARRHVVSQSALEQRPQPAWSRAGREARRKLATAS